MQIQAAELQSGFEKTQDDWKEAVWPVTFGKMTTAVRITN